MHMEPSEVVAAHQHAPGGWLPYVAASIRLKQNIALSERLTRTDIALEERFLAFSP